MNILPETLSIWIPWAAVMLLLILGSAFFSSSETAFFFLNRDQIAQYAAGTSRQRLIAGLMQNPDRLLTGILFWNLLINLAYFAVGIALISRLGQAGRTGSAAVLSLLNLAGMILFGEVIPKSAAVMRPAAVARTAAWPLAAALVLLDPVIPVLDRCARALRRMFWPHVRRETQLSQDDLERALDLSAALGHDMQAEEQHVLHNILDLSEIHAEELMRPRRHCVTVQPHQQPDSVRLLNLVGTDYLLVQRRGGTEILGVVPLDFLDHRPGLTFAELAQPVVYVPWCATAAQVLTELETRYRRVAAVVHEHGDLVGLLSWEDLMAGIVSEAPSRTRRVLQREPLIEIDTNRFHVEGLVTLRYLAARLRVSLTPEDETLYTVAGLFQNRLTRIPERGDQVTWHGWTLTAIDVTDRGLVRVLAEPVDLLSSDQEHTP